MIRTGDILNFLTPTPLLKVVTLTINTIQAIMSSLLCCLRANIGVKREHKQCRQAFNSLLVNLCAPELAWANITML